MRKRQGREREREGGGRIREKKQVNHSRFHGYLSRTFALLSPFIFVFSSCPMYHYCLILLSLWLVIWMLNNIGVTLLNKAAFAKVDFHYPFFLSAVHMACNALGSQYVFWSQSQEINKGDDSPKQQETTTSLLTRLLGTVQRKHLDKTGQRSILLFSVIFSLNIAIGNVSLKFVSVNFNQVMRSLVPAITIAMGMYLGKEFSTRRKLAVLPIILGVAMACFGDMSYTAVGFFFTCMCVFLAALKAVAAGEMLTGALKLHPVDLLGHMAPLALVQCLFMALVTGEIKDIAGRWSAELAPTVDVYPMFVVWFSGLCSFTLNISSLQANKLTSPLTLCIAANVKQVLMIWLSTMIFGVEITPLNGAGIAVVLAGSARYSYVSVQEKTCQPPTVSRSGSNRRLEEGTKKNEIDEEQGESSMMDTVPLTSGKVS